MPRRTEDEAEVDFAREATQRRASFIGEFWEFARHTKRWWMIPIIVILLGLGLLVVVTSSGAGSLIYPLF